MLITDIDKFLDFILSVIEEEIIVSSMHQNYVFFDRDELKNAIKIAIDYKDTDFNYIIKKTKERYLQ